MTKSSGSRIGPVTKILFILIILVVFFGAGELILRMLNIQVFSSDGGRHDRLFYFEMSKSKEGFDSALVLGVKVLPLTEEHYRINGLLKPKEQGAFRVLCLGDSSTIGDGVKADETYCAQLENVLAEKMSPRAVEAINAGFFGYSSYQGKILYEKYQDILQPDAVIFYFGANDQVFAPIREDKDWEQVPVWAMKLNAWLYVHSSMYRFLRNVNARYVLQLLAHPIDEKARNIPYRYRVSDEDFPKNLEAIKKMAAKSNGQVYVVPYYSHPGDRLDPTHHFWNFSDPKMIDLLPYFKKEFEQGRTPFVDDIHPNPKGHKIIADLLADMICRDFTCSEQEE